MLDFTKLRKIAMETATIEHPWEIIDADPDMRVKYEQYLAQYEDKHLPLEELLNLTETHPDLSQMARDYAAMMIAMDLSRVYMTQNAWEHYKSVKSVMENAF